MCFVYFSVLFVCHDGKDVGDVCNINFTAESIRSGENRIVTWLRISDSDTDYEVPSNEQLFDPLSETLPAGIARPLRSAAEEAKDWEPFFKIDCICDTDELYLISGCAATGMGGKT